MSAKKAIIFDFDGTILDTETPGYHAWREIYGKYGATLDVQIWGRFIGTHLEEVTPYTILREQIAGLPDVSMIEQQVNQVYLERMAEETLRPGVLQVIEEANQRGVLVAVASSSTEEWVKRHLKNWQIHTYFSTIAASDHVKRVKPDPELYQIALRNLGIHADQAVAIEDSPNGALAAKRAGLCCIVVANPITAQLSFGEHDYRLDTLEEFQFQLHMK